MADVSTGLIAIGAGLAFGLSAIGAGMAEKSIGAAAIGAMAEKEEVEIKTYRIIYDALDDIKSAMIGLLDPEYKEVVLGTLEVRETYKVSNVGTIAGCYVQTGKITRNSKVRVIRQGIVILDTDLGSLKRFKDDVKEVNTGYECGVTIERFNDIKIGDLIEAYIIEEIKVKSL